MKKTEEQKQEYIALLHKYLVPGSTVYTVLRKVSASGMSRQIDLYTFIEDDNKIRKIYLSGYAAVIMGWRRHKDTGALIVGGCGMDMGFHAVYSLSRRLFPEGFAVSGRGRNGDTSGYDIDGGYALNQEWI